jgi:hypothetical protein
MRGVKVKLFYIVYFFGIIFGSIILTVAFLSAEDGWWNVLGGFAIATYIAYFVCSARDEEKQMEALFLETDERVKRILAEIDRLQAKEQSDLTPPNE